MSPLYCIVDAELARARGFGVPELARRFLDGGARLLQLRAKAAPSGQLLEWADAIQADAGACGATLIINDRADIAAMAGTAGVHVGQDDVPAVAIRGMAPAGFQIGVSTHTVDQIDAAARAPIDYLAIGPVFGTGTKDTGYAPVGLDMVRRAARNDGGLPVVAIGGITLQNATSVLSAGASSVAVISDLLAGDPAARVRTYLETIGARGEPV